MMPKINTPKHEQGFLYGSVLAVLMLAPQMGFAGGDGDGEFRDKIPEPPPYTSPDKGGGYRPRPPVQIDNREIERAAIFAECGLGGTNPSSAPFDRDGYLSPAWQNINISRFQYRRTFAYSTYNNAVCEKFLMRMLRQDQSGFERFKDRCKFVKEDILDALGEGRGRDGRRRGSSDAGLFSSTDDFFGTGGGDHGSDRSGQCDDAESHGGHTLFACRSLAFREIRDDSAARRAAAQEIKEECEKAGVNMEQRRMTQQQYNSYANSGVHYQGAYCGGGGPGGVVVLQQKNSWVSDLIKVGLPMWALNNANKRQAANAQLAIQNNHALGFPSAVTAGGNTPWNQSGGAWHGGAGYGYSGMAGACPQGFCHGNAGMVVGGMPGMMMPGMGQCGVPPYAAWNAACAGAGMPGVLAPGMAMPGMVGTMPGPYGTLNDGRMPAAIPQGAGGVPGTILGQGAAGMPGPYGTLNGNNGWGNMGNMGAWGPGGLYGSTAFMGGANPMAAQQAAMMAQQMQDYAKQIQRQAELSQKADQQYRTDLEALYKVYGKSTQSFMAAQQAQYSLGGLQQSQMGMGMIGMTGYQSMYQGGYMGVPMGTYYPPMAAPAGNGLSIGFGLNYSR